MKVFLNRLYDKHQKERGAYFWGYEGEEPSLKEKLINENKVIDYAINVLYPNEDLNIFKDIYPERHSILITKGIDEIPFDIVEL